MLMSRTITLAGGWQSTLERQALKMRKPGSLSNIIYFLAKGVGNFKIPKRLRSDLDNGKILIVSSWMNAKRIDKTRVAERDKLILSEISRFLFLNIDEGGNLEELFFRCLELGKKVFILDHFSNYKWFNPEVYPLSVKNAEKLV